MHRPRTIRAAVAVPLAALALAGTAAVPAAAAGASWEVTTASGDFGAGRENYRYTLDPGGRVEDGLVVANHGTAPLHLAVYAADGFTAGDGRLDLAAKGTRSSKVGAWVRTERPDVTVPAGRSAEVPFTVALPHDAAPGEYLGGVVTQATDGADAGRRLGIRIRLRVGGNLRPSLSVEHPRVRYSGTPNPFGKGDATVTYTIHNTGDTILAARQAVSVAGPFGGLRVRAGRIADSPQLLPGETWKVTVPVRGVAPAGRLTGTVTVVPLLTDAAGSTASLAAVTTTAHAWTAPWTWPLLLGALVAVFLIFRHRRRKSRAEGVHGPGEQALPEPETADRT